MPKSLIKNTFLFSLFFLTRLWENLQFPPFVDELLYIRWSEEISQNVTSLFLPILEDGQPPLYFWLAGLLKSLSSIDSLIILRGISILFGFACLLLLIRLGTKVKNPHYGTILGYLYTLFPMFLWYDRLAMRESMITCAGLLVINGLVDRFLYQDTKGIRWIILGFLFGITIKGTAFLFLPTIVVSYALFSRTNRLKRGDYYMFATVIISSLVIFLFAQSIFQKGGTFLLSLSEITTRLYPNFYSTIRWLIEYSTMPIFVFTIIWGYLMYHQVKPLFLLSALIFSLTLAIEIVTAKIYFPRYFLWVIPLWLLPLGWGIEKLWSRLVGKLFILILFLGVIKFDYLLIKTPPVAPFPAIERWQYVTGWPSGYSISEFANKVTQYPIDIMVVEKNEACKTGLPYYTNPSYSIILTTDTQSIVESLKDQKSLYLCLNQAQSLPNFDLTEQYSLARPAGESSLRLYSINQVYDQK